MFLHFLNLLLFNQKGNKKFSLKLHTNIIPCAIPSHMRLALGDHQQTISIDKFNIYDDVFLTSWMDCSLNMNL